MSKDIAKLTEDLTKIDQRFCEFVQSFAKNDRTSKLFDRTICKS